MEAGAELVSADDFFRRVRGLELVPLDAASIDRLLV